MFSNVSLAKLSQCVCEYPMGMDTGKHNPLGSFLYQFISRVIKNLTGAEISINRKLCDKYNLNFAIPFTIINLSHFLDHDLKYFPRELSPDGQPI